MFYLPVNNKKIFVKFNWEIFAYQGIWGNFRPLELYDNNRYKVYIVIEPETRCDADFLSQTTLPHAITCVRGILLISLNLLNY